MCVVYRAKYVSSTVCLKVKMGNKSCFLYVGYLKCWCLIRFNI
jgi:hypothetical protein